MTEIEQLRLKILNSETFCFYPFTQISTNPGGHMKPCCYHIGGLKKQNNLDYNIHLGDTFDDVWNSESMVKLRQDLYQGTIPQSCARCIRDGDTSMRSRSIQEYRRNHKVFHVVAETIKNDFKSIAPPSYLELKPSNLCNLKCMICNSYDSSQIAKELKELSSKYTGIKVQDGRFIEISSTPGVTENNNSWISNEDPDWSDNEEIWKNFERLAPHLEVLSFAGGEPTIMPSVIKTLNYVVDNNYAKNITVFLSSNFTNLNKKFLELMPRFKKFELIASIDGFDKVNDYCRFPSKWSQVSKNYAEAKNYMVNERIKILMNITVNSLNILNLVDLLNFIEEHANQYPYFKEWPYNLNLIFHPLEQQICMLPEDMKLIAIARLENYLRTSQILRDFPGLDSKIHLCISELSKPFNPELFQTFKKRVNVLDDHRNIFIGDYIPELAEIFKK